MPWVVAWTGEQSFDLQESQDFPGLVDLLQRENPGEGTPKFKQLHVTRHRRALVQHLCHVCGRRTLRNDRYIFPLHSGALVPRGKTDMLYAGNIPPVHLGCARRAVVQCPHLNMASAMPVSVGAEDTVLMPRLDVVEGMEDLARTLPRGLRVVFSCFRLYGQRFSRKMERLHAVKIS